MKVQKKENAYNRKQSASVVKEKDEQMKDLVKDINSLNEWKLNSVSKKIHENMEHDYKKLQMKYSELQQKSLQGNYSQESLQGQNQNGKVFIMPSLEWVENPTNGMNKYKYNPTPRCMDNHPKSIPGALNEYYALKDSGNVEALNEWNELYNKPKKYQHDPGHYPKEGQIVT